MDFRLFRLINGLAGHTPLLDQLMLLIVSDYVGTTLQALGLLGFWFEGADPETRQANQRAVLRAIGALLLSGLIVALSNLVYFRPRPFTDHEVNVLFYYPSDSSFPSNSAAAVFSLATAIWLQDRRWGGVLLGLAAWFALARVYVGVHYPSDVLAGAALGAGAAWLLTRKARRLTALFDRAIALARWLNLGG